MTSKFNRICGVCSALLSGTCYTISGILWSIATGNYLRDEPVPSKEFYIGTLVLFWIAFISMWVALLLFIQEMSNSLVIYRR